MTTKIPYTEPDYLFPPRPKRKIKPSNLNKYETGEYLLQPKMDGSCAVIFTDGVRVIVKSRHKRSFSRFKMNTREIKEAHRGEPGSWMVFVGEYMNKSRQDELGCVWNHKLVIFDILVYNSELLLGMSTIDRMRLLEEVYPERPFKPHLSKISRNVWRVKSIYESDGYLDKFNKIKSVDMFEGFVLKKMKAVLDPPFRNDNNSTSQLKVRKPTKNYRY